ncbi:MAG TPA: aminotransferase class I/II-fold pyridoxal phosphate-dependent enzyme [Streptosporangiaceae bacterium]
MAIPEHFELYQRDTYAHSAAHVWRFVLERQLQSRNVANLTEIELAAIESGINLADGHARYELTASQQKIINQLCELYALAAETSPALLDQKAQSAFLTAVGQHSAMSRAEVLSCYSSSVAMEITARSLYTSGVRRVALIHPTFDNIPDILRGVGMNLMPVSEESLVDGSGRLPDGAEVLFVTTPNNPTGEVLSPEVLTHWARECASRGIVLVLDSSFRGFDERAQYDHYAILVQEGCRYIIMEDTGKLWPTLDLKIGFLAFPRDERLLPLHRIYTDILLGVSPLLMLLVQRFAEDAHDGGFSELHRFIHSNRALLRKRLSGIPAISFPDTDSRISVERLALPTGFTGSDMRHTLCERAVHVLPCRQFYWAEPEAGERYIRLALSRPPEMIRTAAAAICDYIECS